MPNNTIYPGAIIDFETKERRDFIHIPEQINETIETNYNEITIIGRSSPIQGYSDTGARTVSFDLTFVATELDAANEVDAIRRQVFEKMRFLQSFAFPEYDGNVMKPPHRIQIIIGSFLNIVGILQSVPLVWRAPYGIGQSDARDQGSGNRVLAPNYPMVADINLTVIETLAIPLSFEQVRRAGATFEVNATQTITPRPETSTTRGPLR